MGHRQFFRNHYNIINAVTRTIARDVYANTTMYISQYHLTRLYKKKKKTPQFRLKFDADIDFYCFVETIQRIYGSIYDLPPRYFHERKSQAM